jgi:hypothetical protein
MLVRMAWIIMAASATYGLNLADTQGIRMRERATIQKPVVVNSSAFMITSHDDGQM